VWYSLGFLAPGKESPPTTSPEGAQEKKYQAWTTSILPVFRRPFRANTFDDILPRVSARGYNPYPLMGIYGCCNCATNLAV